MTSSTLPAIIFNAHAARLGVPMMWLPESGQVPVDFSGDAPFAQGRPHAVGVPPDTFVRDGKPTMELEGVVRMVHDGVTGRHAGALPDALRARLQADLAERELDIRLTHVDAAHFSAHERAMITHIMEAGWHIRRLHLLQRDPHNLDYEARVWGLGDPLAVELFYNNHGPWCERIAGGCGLFDDAPRRPGEHLYPAGMTPSVFQALADMPGGRDLISPFVAVERMADGAYRAVPFGVHPLLRDEAGFVATALRNAARYAVSPRGAGLAERRGWEAFRRYLRAAADAFVSDHPYPWDAANAAWVAIPVSFKYGLRIGPDETYWDGAVKGHAGYSVHFGVSDPEQQQLVASFAAYGFQRMEDEFAALIGHDVYTPRDVGGAVPLRVVRELFVDGEGRASHSMVGGFSLPNWGPSAMGKKWVMQSESELGLQKSRRMVAAFLGDAYVPYITSDQASAADTSAHEYFHGFGPQEDTPVRPNGHTVPDADGTPTTLRVALTPALQQVLEETKASVVHFWLHRNMERAGVIDAAERRRRAVAGITWCFSHVSRELFNPDGTIKTYSAVGAIILGHLLNDRAVTFDTQRGQWDIDFDRLPDSAATLLGQLGRIQATGDRDGGQAVVDRFTRDAAALVRLQYARIVQIARDQHFKPTVAYYQLAIDE